MENFVNLDAGETNKSVPETVTIAHETLLGIRFKKSSSDIVSKALIAGISIILFCLASAEGIFYYIVQKQPPVTSAEYATRALHQGALPPPQ